MKPLIALSITLVGAVLVAFPLIASVLLALFGRTAFIDRGDREVCMIAGCMVLFVGVLMSIIAFALADRGANEPKDKLPSE